MPCHDGGPSRLEVLQGEHAKLEVKYDRMKKYAEHRGEQLCRACKELEKNGIPIPAEISEWWQEHKADPGHSDHLTPEEVSDDLRKIIMDLIERA